MIKKFLLLFVLLVCIIAPIYPVRAKQKCPLNVTVSYDGYSGNMDDLECGYTQDGYWIPALITNSFWWTEQPQFTSTRALYQNKGVIDDTAAIHHYTLTDGIQGFVSLNSPAQLGWKFYIRKNADSQWIRVQNVDNVKREHYYYHAIYEDSGIELSYELAEQFGVIDLVNPNGTRYLYGLQICLADDPSICTGTPIDYTEWVRENIRFVGDLNFDSAWAENKQ